MLPEELQQRSGLEPSAESSSLFHNLVAQPPGLKQNHHVCWESGRNELACWSPAQVPLPGYKSHGDHQGEKLLWLSAQFKRFAQSMPFVGTATFPKAFVYQLLSDLKLSTENTRTSTSWYQILILSDTSRLQTTAAKVHKSLHVWLFMFLSQIHVFWC